LLGKGCDYILSASFSFRGLHCLTFVFTSVAYSCKITCQVFDYLVRNLRFVPGGNINIGTRLLLQLHQSSENVPSL